MHKFIKGLIVAFLLFAPSGLLAEQADYEIQNQTFPDFRADLNNNLGAIATNNSGATEPTATFAFQWWADTTTGLLKQRNSINTAFITIGTLADVNLGLLPLSGATLSGRLGFAEGTPIASSATTDISSVGGNIIHITGTTDISVFTMATGQIQDIIFDDVLTLIFAASTNKTLTGASIITAVDDVARYYFDGTDVVMIDYVRFDGKALVGSIDLASPGDIGSVTPATFLAVDNMRMDGNLIDSTSGDLNLKAVSGSELTFQDDVDPTKEIFFDLNGATTSTKTTLVASQTVNRSIILPDADDTLMGKATSDTLTNKTIDANGTGNSITNIDLTADVIGITPIANGGTNASVAATALTNLGGIGAATSDTLTNKTFNANDTGNSLSNVDVADLANGTDGELITWDTSGVADTVAVGTVGQVLTSGGAGVAPTFQTPAGGGFRGALVSKTANQSINGGSLITLTWNSEVFDTDTIHDNSVNNSRLTVPAGVTVVRLTGNVTWTSAVTVSSSKDVVLRKNGADVIGGFGSRIEDNNSIGGNPPQQNVVSSPLQVVGGDFFEFIVRQGSDFPGSVTAGGGIGTWFAMEIIE